MPLINDSKIQFWTADKEQYEITGGVLRSKCFISLTGWESPRGLENLSEKKNLASRWPAGRSSHEPELTDITGYQRDKRRRKGARQCSLTSYFTVCWFFLEGGGVLSMMPKRWTQESGSIILDVRNKTATFQTHVSKCVGVIISGRVQRWATSEVRWSLNVLWAVTLWNAKIKRTNPEKEWNGMIVNNCIELYFVDTLPVTKQKQIAYQKIHYKRIRPKIISFIWGCDFF